MIACVIEIEGYCQTLALCVSGHCGSTPQVLMHHLFWILRPSGPHFLTTPYIGTSNSLFKGKFCKSFPDATFVTLSNWARYNTFCLPAQKPVRWLLASGFVLSPIKGGLHLFPLLVQLLMLPVRSSGLWCLIGTKENQEVRSRSRGNSARQPKQQNARERGSVTRALHPNATEGSHPPSTPIPATFGVGLDVDCPHKEWGRGQVPALGPGSSGHYPVLSDIESLSAPILTNGDQLLSSRCGVKSH